jgi:methyl-accepting chemotaxis protein
MTWKISLRSKMIFAFTFVASFLLVVGAANRVYQKKIVTNYDRIATINLPNMATFGEMRAQALSYIDDVVYLTKTNLTPDKRASKIKEVSSDLQAYEAADKAYNEIPFQAGEEEIYRPVNESWKKLTEVGKKLVELSANNQDPKVQAEQDQLLTGGFSDATDEYTKYFLKLKKFHQDMAVDYKGQAAQAADTGEVVTLTAIGLGFASALLVGFFFASFLAKSLTQLSGALAQGAGEVASASTQLSTSSTELSASSTEQAASLQETTASMEEISAMIRKNSDNAESSRTLSSQSMKSAEEGQQVVTEMGQAMKDIDASIGDVLTQVEASNQEIASIVQVIEEIGTKTKVINDIVFQTKLLSFNASVEAARAGEHGKGFAVVAEEVGALAEMSGNAAREIGDLLAGSVEKVNTIVNSSKTKIEALIAAGKDKVEAGGVVAERCKQVLEHISRNVMNADQMIAEIATASQEQSQGVTEVSRAISQLDHTTQQNAMVSQQTATASNQLSSQAHHLNEAVRSLIELIYGHADDSAGSSHQTVKGEGIQLASKRHQSSEPKAA